MCCLPDRAGEQGCSLLHWLMASMTDRFMLCQVSRTGLAAHAVYGFRRAASRHSRPAVPLAAPDCHDLRPLCVVAAPLSLLFRGKPALVRVAKHDRVQPHLDERVAHHGYGGEYRPLLGGGMDLINDRGNQVACRTWFRHRKISDLDDIAAPDRQAGV